MHHQHQLNNGDDLISVLTEISSFDLINIKNSANRLIIGSTIQNTTKIFLLRHQKLVLLLMASWKITKK